MAHQVFISHSNKDKQMANAICHYLEQEKRRCWKAPRDIMLGASFASEIADAIPKSKVLLIMLSSTAQSTAREIRYIRAKKIALRGTPIEFISEITKTI